MVQLKFTRTLSKLKLSSEPPVTITEQALWRMRNFNKRIRREGGRLRVMSWFCFPKGYLGGQYDVEKVWSEWMGENGKLEVHGIERGVGHFLAEEEPEETAGVARTFHERHV
jgi:hypothetical protein